jgi:hypothetical protein
MPNCQSRFNFQAKNKLITADTDCQIPEIFAVAAIIRPSTLPFLTAQKPAQLKLHGISPP